MRIKNGEIRRNKGLDQIRAIGDGGVPQPDRERIEDLVPDRAEPLLIQDREDCDHGCNQEQRHLFDHQPESGSIEQRPAKAPERPEIKEEQYEWKRYRHRFCHVRAEESETNERITATAGPGCIMRVAPDCPEEEQTVEDVFPRREPC